MHRVPAIVVAPHASSPSRVRRQGVAGDHQAEAIGALRIVDAGEIHDDPSPVIVLGVLDDGDRHVADTDRLTDGRCRRRIVLGGHPEQLHDPGEEDRRAAGDRQQQQGPGAHGRRIRASSRCDRGGVRCHRAVARTPRGCRVGALAGCGSADPPAATPAPSATAAPGTQAAAGAVPAAIDFTAPAVGGGEIDLRRLRRARPRAVVLGAVLNDLQPGSRLGRGGSATMGGDRRLRRCRLVGQRRRVPGVHRPPRSDVPPDQ